MLITMTIVYGGGEMSLRSQRTNFKHLLDTKSKEEKLLSMLYLVGIRAKEYIVLKNPIVLWRSKVIRGQ